MISRVFAALLLFLTTACGSTPEPEAPYLAVRTRPLHPAMGWVRHFGAHSYLVWREKGAPRPVITHVRRWGMVEEGGYTWYPEHPTHAVWTGAAAEDAIRRARGVLAAGHLQEVYADDGYLIWPGPNSNSFVAMLCRSAGIAVDLPPDAVGKDWPQLIPWVLDARVTTTRLGAQVDVLVVGAQAGLTGVEAHVLGSAVGLSWWPPALKLPFLPRLGMSAW